jgi:hypothetical protein
MKIEYLLIQSSVSNTIPDTRIIKQAKRNLSDYERESIYTILNQNSSHGKLPRGILSEISKRFGVKPRTISRIWYQGQESIKRGYRSPIVCSRIKFKSGRKKSTSLFRTSQGAGFFKSY